MHVPWSLLCKDIEVDRLNNETLASKTTACLGGVFWNGLRVPDCNEHASIFTHNWQSSYIFKSSEP